MIIDIKNKSKILHYSFETSCALYWCVKNGFLSIIYNGEKKKSENLPMPIITSNQLSIFAKTKTDNFTK